MSNGDSFGPDWSPRNDTCNTSNCFGVWHDVDYRLGLEFDTYNQGPENATIEAQSGADGPALLPDVHQEKSSSLTSSRNKKRDWESVFGDLSKAKGKGVKNQRRRRSRVTISTGQASTSKQRPEPKTQEGLLKAPIVREAVPALTKVYKDRVSRRMKNDKMADMEATIWVFRYMMAYNVSHLFPQVLSSFTLDIMQWPVRPDLQDIKEKIHEIQSSYNIDGLEDEAKQRFVELEDEFKRLNRRRETDMKITGKLDAIFTCSLDFSMETQRKEDFIVKNLRKELSSVCPWLITGDQEQAQDYGSLGTREMSQYDFSTFENQLFNNYVQDFDGLEQALNHTSSMKSTPDYLEPFAAREEARGEATEFPWPTITYGSGNVGGG